MLYFIQAAGRIGVKKVQTGSPCSVSSMPRTWVHLPCIIHIELTKMKVTDEKAPLNYFVIDTRRHRPLEILLAREKKNIIFFQSSTMNLVF